MLKGLSIKDMKFLCIVLRIVFGVEKELYKVDISISNHVYYRIAEDIQIARYQQQRQSYFPMTYNNRYNGTYDIMKKLKERILFSSSFNVIVKRKFTILKDNEPYVRDAMGQIKSIIDSKFGNVNDKFKNIQNII